MNQTADIFSNYLATKKLTEAFPLIVKIIKQILEYEEEKNFLPEDVTLILHAMLDLKSSYTKLARERAVPRKQPATKGPDAQVYPFYPVHSVKNNYAADYKPDKTDDKD